MVARRENRSEESDAVDDEYFEDIHILSEEEAWECFNDQGLRTLGVAGEDFLRRWDSGDYRPIPDTPEGRKISRLVMLLPFARPTSF